MQRNDMLANLWDSALRHRRIGSATTRMWRAVVAAGLLIAWAYSTAMRTTDDGKLWDAFEDDDDGWIDRCG